MNNKFKTASTAFFVILLTQIWIFAQDGKSISDLARKAVWGTPVSAAGNGVKGTLTPVHVSADQMKNIGTGFLIGLLDLEITNKEYDKVRSGKFDLFLKKEDAGLRLYLEEKGKIAAVLEVFDSAPEDSANGGNGRGLLAFPYPAEDKRASVLSPINSRPAFGFTAPAPLKKKKIYIQIEVNGHLYWVWSGATRDVR